jgi:hypothetical protein
MHLRDSVNYESSSSVKSIEPFWGITYCALRYFSVVVIDNALIFLSSCTKHIVFR